MKTIVIMNNIITFLKALAWFVFILLVAIAATDFDAPWCTFPLTIVEIFEGPGSLEKAVSTAAITVREVPSSEDGVTLSTPTCFREARTFFNKAAAISV